MKYWLGSRKMSRVAYHGFCIVYEGVTVVWPYYIECDLMCCVVKEQNINGQRIRLTLSSCDQESQLSVVGFFSWNEHCGCPLRWAAQVLKGVINLNISNWSSKWKTILNGSTEYPDGVSHFRRCKGWKQGQSCIFRIFCQPVNTKIQYYLMKTIPPDHIWEHRMPSLWEKLLLHHSHNSLLKKKWEKRGKVLFLKSKVIPTQLSMHIFSVSQNGKKRIIHKLTTKT